MKLTNETKDKLFIAYVIAVSIAMITINILVWLK